MANFEQEAINSNEVNVVRGHEQILQNAVYGDRAELGDKGMEMMRINDTLVRDIQNQAARMADSVLKSTLSLPLEHQQELIRGIKKDLQPNDVVYHAFLQKYEAHQMRTQSC